METIPSPARSPAGDVLRVAYLALVRDSLIPSEGRRIGEAALAALARIGAVPSSALPGEFGVDAERDGAWLASLAVGEGPWWEVVAAMAWDSDVPHTALSDADFRAGMQAWMRGEPNASPGFFLWRMDDGRLALADVDERGAGHAAGLRAGDVLLDVDGRAARRANSQVLPFYAAGPGRVFTLGIEREGSALTIDLEPARGDVPPVVAELLADRIAWIRVRWFAVAADGARDTAAQTRLAIERLVADGARGLLVDLRSGLGGYLDAVAGIVSALSESDVIAADRQADGSERKVRRVGEPAWLRRPLVVLVNEQTISAAEVLALALEELEGAVIVGTATAGGLNGLGFVELGDDYRLAVPLGVSLGPRSREPREGLRLVPHVHAPNPTGRELREGIDPALEAARRVASGVA